MLGDFTSLSMWPSLIRQRAALDKVVKKLEEMYFEKYGYKFPLTGGLYARLVDSPRYL